MKTKTISIGTVVPRATPASPRLFAQYTLNARLTSRGYLTVPEDRSYGDFITPITTTNANIVRQLISEWQH